MRTLPINPLWQSHYVPATFSQVDPKSHTIKLMIDGQQTKTSQPVQKTNPHPPNKLLHQKSSDINQYGYNYPSLQHLGK